MSEPEFIAVDLPTRLVYADEIEEGDHLWYQEEFENPDWRALVDSQPALAQISDTPFAQMLRDMPPEHLHRDAWAIVLRTRHEPPLVSFILVKEDGEQVGFATHQAATIKVRDNGIT